MKKLLSRGRRCPGQQLLDKQLETLFLRGCPVRLVDGLRKKCGEVLEAVQQKNLKPRIGFSPFLPVVPFSALPANAQMEMVRGASRTGIVSLNTSRLTDEEPLLDHPYFILGVEDGRRFLNRGTAEAEAEILARGLKPLTAAEGIALAIQTEVLKSHGIDLLGSRYGREVDEETGRIVFAGDIPLVYSGDEPELTYDPPRRFGLEERGVPSRDKEIIS